MTYAARKRTAEYVYTGRPCKSGHIGPRYRNGNCVECALTRHHQRYTSDQTFASKKRKAARERARKDPERTAQRNRRYRDTHRVELKGYRRLRYLENRAAILESVRRYRAEHPDRVAESDRKYRLGHRDQRRRTLAQWLERNRDARQSKVQAYGRAHYSKNRETYQLKRTRRRTLSVRATPTVASREAMLAFYRRATELTRTTGIRMSVDHIVPLVGKRDGVHVVCGLNWEHNLRVIPLSENKAKGSYGWEDLA